MKKQDADRVIKEYIKPMYGFAMNKTRNINDAEELASMIIIQIYDVLIKKDNFIDLNSYVFRIAHNVWTKYLSEKTRVINNVFIDDVNIIENKNIENDIVKKEIIGKLRLEIAFLSSQQRKIVLLHYYKGLKIREIAKELDLSEGTVKWHLYEIKKEMKNSMEVLRTIGNLGINPINFSNIGHLGNPGSRGDTKDFLKKRITQNISYAAYHKSLTINEIAEELGISPIFVEDEVNELEEYGFMNKVKGEKYETNILIEEPSEEKYEELNSLYKKYANILVEKYFLQFFENRETFKKVNIYSPDNDFNFLMWSIIPYSMQKFIFAELQKITFDEVSIIRKDGGNYISTAALDKKINKSDKFNYNCCGDMYRSNSELPILGWQINTVWSKRDFDWRDNIMSDYIGLYHFINGKLEENDVNIDIYRRLIDKGYLFKNESGYKVNVVYLKSKNILNEIIPVPSDDFIKIGKKFDKEVYEIEKIGEPIHMYKTIKYICQNNIAKLKTYVLKNLVDRGLLKEVKVDKEKSISTILFLGE